MHGLKRLMHLGVLCMVTLLLSQCNKVANDSPMHRSLISPYTMPADAYLALADRQSGEEKQSLLLMAAGRRIYDGQWRTGLDILKDMSPSSPVLLNERQILLAKVDLIRGKPSATITTLAKVSQLSQLPAFYQAQYHDMLASAYQATGAPLESIQERMKLESLLPDQAAKMNNRRILWLSLTSLSAPQIDTLMVETSDQSELKGWLKLAKISRLSYSDSSQMMADIHDWQAMYPTHPGNQILPSAKSSAANRLYASPKRMALLLPVTGPLAGPGLAVEDGFMAKAGDAGVDVKVYNTDKADVGKLYQRAVAEGAQYVVGPLSKADVAVVAKLSHPVPTLLLNEAGTSLDANAFTFGLSPSNEARQVAVKARKNGFSRALVIAPEGSWGRDVASAFVSQWTSSGAQVMEAFYYQPQENLGNGIRTLLRVSEADARSRPAKPNIKMDTFSKRRHDFDVIFLVAYPSKARQIVPLLRYYFAGEVPVYATSSVYSGSSDRLKDRDLDGVIFCDMPWVFQHQQAEHHWAEALNSYNRLYALGLDSFALATELNQLMLFPALGLKDNSGVLYLNGAHVISRILVFAQMRQGKAEVLSSNQ